MGFPVIKDGFDLDGAQDLQQLKVIATSLIEVQRMTGKILEIFQYPGLLLHLFDRFFWKVIQKLDRLICTGLSDDRARDSAQPDDQHPYLPLDPHVVHTWNSQIDIHNHLIIKYKHKYGKIEKNIYKKHQLNYRFQNRYLWVIQEPNSKFCCMVTPRFSALETIID